MKKIIFGLAVLTTLASFAASYSYYENLLEGQFGSAREIEVTKVTNQGSREFVDVDVTNYGETRSSWCVVEDGEVLQCMDSWFNHETSH